MTERNGVAGPEPFARVFRHWIGERPYVCLGDNCPLCGVGDEAKAVMFFDATDSGPEGVRALEGPEVTQHELMEATA
jgi:hypothetical protein